MQDLLRKWIWWLAIGASSCAAPPTLWKLDTIALSDSSSNLSRLTFHPPHSNLELELLKGPDGEVLTFLTAQRHTFAPSAEDARLTHVLVRIEGDEKRVQAYLRKGGMRLRLLKEIGEPIILALKEGKKVELLLDGFQGTILPDSFPSLFSQFLEGAAEPFQYMKGI
jgi:hypothetical protein